MNIDQTESSLNFRSRFDLLPSLSRAIFQEKNLRPEDRGRNKYKTLLSQLFLLIEFLTITYLKYMISCVSRPREQQSCQPKDLVPSVVYWNLTHLALQIKGLETYLLTLLGKEHLSES
jgi:hypothetical protein